MVYGKGKVTANEEGDKEKIVIDFTSKDQDTYLKGWKSRGGDPKEVYSIKKETLVYLSAKAIDSAVSIAKKFEYDPREYPYLHWKWRVFKLPKGGDERYKKTGDSAAAIYVIFEGTFRPDNIKYVWSSSLPVGTITESPYNSKTKIIVLRNNKSPIGKWVEEKVNVYEDYKKLFGHEPKKKVQAIGIMSDSDNTKSEAIADYGKVWISKE